MINTYRFSKRVPFCLVSPKETLIVVSLYLMNSDITKEFYR